MQIFLVYLDQGSPSLVCGLFRVNSRRAAGRFVYLRLLGAASGHNCRRSGKQGVSWPAGGLP